MNGRTPCSAKETPRAEAQRERILCAAQKCFIEHGFHAASMANIAEGVRRRRLVRGSGRDRPGRGRDGPGALRPGGGRGEGVRNGRAQFLSGRDERYDVIAMDAFGSSSIPFLLVTREVFGLIASRLNPGGILAINLESDGWEGPVVKAIAATLKPHFREVLALPAQPVRGDLGNVVLLASNSELALRPDAEEGARGRFDCDAYYWSAGASRGWNSRFVPDTRRFSAAAKRL